MKVLLLVPYPLESAPSQRFRFEQYLHFLDQEGIEYKVEPFLTQSVWRIFYKPGHFFQKLGAIQKGFSSRWRALRKLSEYDHVFVHREIAPLGLGMLHKKLLKASPGKLIYDFDDAIWMENYSSGNRFFAWLKRYGHAEELMKAAAINSCGNPYLAAHVEKLGGKASIVPTTVDSDRHKWNDDKGEDLIVGWTGSHSTIKYLEAVLPEVAEARKVVPFELVVVSDLDPGWRTIEYTFRSWARETETKDISDFHIGLMPLQTDPWSEGKCGLKALQYMATGAMTLLSPVGVNTEIVSHGVHGFHVNEGEWTDSIIDNLLNFNQLHHIRKAAREKVEQQYSTAANRSKFLALFAHNSEANV